MIPLGSSSGSLAPPLEIVGPPVLTRCCCFTMLSCSCSFSISIDSSRSPATSLFWSDSDIHEVDWVDSWGFCVVEEFCWGVFWLGWFVGDLLVSVGGFRVVEEEDWWGGEEVVDG